MKHSNNDSLTDGWHKSRTFPEAVAHAWKGIFVSFLKERNIKIQFVLLVVALVFSFAIKLSFLEMALIVLIGSVIISLELINTGIEEYLDIVEPHYRQSVRNLKDIFAGAVLIVSLAAVLIGILLFIPPLILLVIGAS